LLLTDPGRGGRNMQRKATGKIVVPEQPKKMDSAKEEKPLTE